MSDFNFDDAKDLDGFDPGAYRPYFNSQGGSVVTLQSPGHPFRSDRVVPSKIAARYTKDQWIRMDRLVINTFRENSPFTHRLLQVPGVAFDGFDGMATMILEHETIDDSDGARQDMAPLSEEPERVFNLQSIPLPITHADCLNETGVEKAAKAVGERVEREVLSAFLNHPKLRASTATNAAVDLANAGFYGPWIAHVLFPEHPGILVLQASPEAVKIIVGMHVTVVQWEDHLKVMCIVVPQVKEDLRGNVGFVLAR